MATAYKVLVDEYTVHKKVGELTDPITGRLLGIQQGSGKVYFKDELIPESAVSPLIVEALEDEDHPSHEYLAARLEKTSGDASQNTALRLGVPFAGYDDMDEEEVLAALVNLPSATIAAVKRYESENENRERIAQYNVGFGESPTDRQEGRKGSDLDEEGSGNEEKAVSDLTTREVPEEGLVQVGDGITGTGDPQIPHGSQKEDGDGKKPAARRRSRRQRPAASGGDSGGSGSGDDE